VGIKRLFVTGASVTVTLAIVLLAPAASAASTSTAVSYSLSGTATINPGAPPGCSDVFGCRESASGSASCASNCAGKPPSGQFSILITTIATHPPSPCRVKRLSGSLSVTWSDETTSTAGISGKFPGALLLKLTGTLDTGGVDYPPETIRVLLNNYPPSPCTAASSPITGTLRISS
jgi:hypothetical protein